MNKQTITVHTLVKNEEIWVKPALLSVLDHVDKLLVWDTGSTDNTVAIIKSIDSSKIVFAQKGKVSREELVSLRNQQIKATETDWLMLVDGDEIWPQKNLKKIISAINKADNNTWGLVNKTRNCIGDIYHFLPENKGHYRIGPWQGHLNIRAIRNHPSLKVVGVYPLEAYTINNIPLQDQPEHLQFIDTWYLHTSHLKRSGWLHQLNVVDRLKKFKFWGRGITLPKSELPEALV